MRSRETALVGADQHRAHDYVADDHPGQLADADPRIPSTWDEVDVNP